MAKKKYVLIEKDGEQGEVMPASVPTWEKHGWTVVEDGSSEAPVPVAGDVPQLDEPDVNEEN